MHEEKLDDDIVLDILKATLWILDLPESIEEAIDVNKLARGVKRRVEFGWEKDYDDPLFVRCSCCGNGNGACGCFCS